jgi:hypothetical protein
MLGQNEPGLDWKRITDTQDLGTLVSTPEYLCV